MHFFKIVTDALSAIREPLLLFNSDVERGNNKKMRYLFIFNNEAFLNLGRIIGIILVGVIVSNTSQTNAIIYGPIILEGL